MSPASLVLALATLSCAPAASAGTLTPETHPMNHLPQASRPAPPNVPPIEHDGVRYEQDMTPPSGPGHSRGGYLAALDPKTGARLWSIPVYTVHDDPAAPVATPDRFFRSMVLVPGGTRIAIEDEAGGRYQVDLADRSVTVIQSPGRPKPAVAAPPLPAPPAPPTPR